jgi:hypothetical protein
MIKWSSFINIQLVQEVDVRQCTALLYLAGSPIAWAPSLVPPIQSLCQPPSTGRYEYKCTQKDVRIS